MKTTAKRFVFTFMALLMAAFAVAPTAFAQTGDIFSQPAKTYALTTGWFQGRQTHYYDFGSNSPTANNGSEVVPAPIYVLITGMDGQGNPQMVPGQHNIIDVVPGDKGYSDLWQVNLVTVPADYVANTFKSADDVIKSGYPVKAPGLLVNCPVVPLNSRLAEPNPTNNSTEPTKGWYKGREVHYFDFGPSPNYTVPIYAFITGMDAQGNPQFVEGQHNIIDVIPGQQGYSAFWNVQLVKVPAGYKANSITSAAQVKASGFQMINPGIVVNCPVVRTDQDVTGEMGSSGNMEGSMPGMPQTGQQQDQDGLKWLALAAGLVLASGIAARSKVFSGIRARDK